jgi:thioredoxin 2
MMATQISGGLIVACPVCATLNRVPRTAYRVPRDKLGPRGICGNCKNALFSAWPITITAANFDSHASRSDLPLLLDFWAS